MRSRVRDAGQAARRWRSWPWRLGVLTLFLAATACLDDALLPNARPGVQLDIRAQAEGTVGGARMVTIDVFYRKADESLAPLRSSPTQVAVTSSGSTEQPVVVQLADCLADPQRIDAEAGGCHLVVTLSLLDATGQELARETTDVESTVLPGQTISVSPVTLLAADLVSISGPEGLVTGDTVTLEAQAYSGDRPLGGRPFTWSSDQPSVVTVDANGFLAAVGPGTATITATTGGVSGTLQVTVALPPNIVKEFGDGAVCEIGVPGDCTFAVRVTTSAEQPLVGAELLWQTPSSGIAFTAYTDSSGLSTAHNLDSATTPGTYTQTATLVQTGQQVTFTYQLGEFFKITIAGDPSGTGSGIVTADAATKTITCVIGVGGATSGTCVADFPKGTTVTLTPAPDVGSVFDGWLGMCVPCGGNPALTVLVDSAMTATATFNMPSF